MAQTDPRPELYWALFVLVQHLSRRMDERLRMLGLTSRQWLLLAVIQRWFANESPTLTDTAARYGTSRQNVKQIALALERHGWLRIQPDANDHRASRLALTDRIAVFATPELEAAGAAFLQDVFAGTAEAELAQMRDSAVALLTRLDVHPAEPPRGVS